MKEELIESYDTIDQDKEDVLDMDLTSVDSAANARRDEIEKQAPNR